MRESEYDWDEGYRCNLTTTSCKPCGPQCAHCRKGSRTPQFLAQSGDPKARDSNCQPEIGSMCAASLTHRRSVRRLFGLVRRIARPILEELILSEAGLPLSEIRGSQRLFGTRLNNQFLTGWSDRKGV